MVKIFIVALFCVAYVQPAVIRTFVVRDVQPRGLHNHEILSSSDSSSGGVKKREATLMKANANTWNRVAFKHQRERRDTPPWVKGRYGRGILHQNLRQLSEGAVKVPREDYEKKVMAFLLNNRLAREANKFHGRLYARQMWHRQRYGREGRQGRTRKAPTSPFIDEEKRISEEEGENLKSSLRKKESAAPGWHHGRYGRRVYGYYQGSMKRETPLWAKGRYGKREKEGDGHELSRRYRKEDENDEQDVDEIYDEGEIEHSEDGHEENAQYFQLSSRADH
uniref:RYamide n=1 Tax=Tripedalia cystophora TaxID=6141 RepID=A0A482A2G8_TRICY|nr:RYamide [Tripedalia cystophora]